MPRHCQAGLELPAAARPYKRTATFTETTVPAALLHDHATKPGVWGVITVLSGRLRYTAPLAGTDIVLDAGSTGIAAPTERHRVEPLGPVSFYVEFWRE